MINHKVYLGVDVGSRRIGLAWADSSVRIAWPLTTLIADESLPEQLRALVAAKQVSDIIVGRPRNQQGQTTQQTRAVEEFVATSVKPLALRLHWQDESLTSVTAEHRLQQRTHAYQKADVDAEAATIILQDFLEKERLSSG